MTNITKEEPKHMKYLKIEDNKGYFLKQEKEQVDQWVEIDKISKDDYTKKQSERENFSNIIPQNQKVSTPQQIQQKQFYFLVIA